jgi:hypothetical protein
MNDKMRVPRLSHAAEQSMGSAGLASLETDLRACHASPEALHSFIARVEALGAEAQQRRDGTALERCKLFLERAEKVLARRERAPLEVKA